jgi:hypothetical protein
MFKKDRGDFFLDFITHYLPNTKKGAKRPTVNNPNGKKGKKRV